MSKVPLSWLCTMATILFRTQYHCGLQLSINSGERYCFGNIPKQMLGYYEAILRSCALLIILMYVQNEK